MRSFIAALLVLFALCGHAHAAFWTDMADALHALSGGKEAAQRVSYGGADYVSGFYDMSCGFKPGLQGERVLIDGREFFVVENGLFSMLLDSGGADAYTLSGTLYCLESQLEEARAYYADPANYDYYCQIGAQYADRDPEFRLLEGMDFEKFKLLMEFAAENAYDPFGRNEGGPLMHLPVPDRDESPELSFYRESRDGCLSSHRGYRFHIIEDKLLLLYYYDYGHGEYEEMVAVEAPADLSEYFVNLLKSS